MRKTAFPELHEDENTSEIENNIDSAPIAKGFM